jgi:hypothetical protein
MASTSQKSPGISLEVTVHVAPSNVQKFLGYLRPAYETVVKEKECTFFEVYLNPSVPGQIHWVEGWTEGVEWLMGVCICPFPSLQKKKIPKKREWLRGV